MDKSYDNDLVSVIMPAYNAERYIEESVTSILNQSYRNLELIIVNDCSNDGTLKLIENFSRIDARVVVLNNDANLGCADSRNRALQVAKGEYIAFCDSDDIWIKNKIEKQLNDIKEHNVDMVFTAYEMIDGSGKLIKCRNIKEQITIDNLLRENSVIFSTTFFLRSSVRNIKFNAQWFHEDYVFLLEGLQKGLIFCGADECLVKYRVHNQGRSFNKIGAAKHRWNIYREFLKLNFWESIYYFFQYIVNGLKKYS